MGNKNGKIYYVAFYERLSKEDGDNEESESIKNQSALLHKFMEELKIKEPENTFIFVDEYIDDGYTGTNFDRPDFNRMLGDIQNKTINLIIAKNLERFGRYAKQVIEYYQEVFPENDIRFMTALESEVDTENENGSIIVLLKAVLGEIYPINLSQNIKAIKFTKAQNGEFQGNTAPYGYKKSPLDKHKLIIDRDVEPVIRKIFEMYAEGYTRFEIVEELNNLQVLPPRKHLQLEKGKGLNGVDSEDFSWKESTITKIIKNPVYIGSMVGRKTFKPFLRKKNRKVSKKEDLIIVTNTHEPIINISLFEKCQKIRERHIDKNCKHDNLYKGLVYCANCGKIANLKYRSKPKKDGSNCEIYSYLCSEANKGIRKNCNNTKSISAKKLNELIIPTLSKQCNAIILEKEDIEKVTQNIKENFLFELERLKKEKNRYEERIKSINEQIKQMYKDKLSNIITMDLFIDIQKEKQLEITQCKKLLVEIENKIQQEQNKEIISYEEVQKLANEFINSNEPSKELMNKLVSRIELDSNRNLNVQFTFADMLKEVC